MSRFSHRVLVITGIALGLWSSGPALAAADPVASIVLSTMAPGVGEWYNSGFAGGFPVVECVMGRVCPCVGFASIIDAAAGHTDDGIRFDFWSSPN